MRLQQVKPLLLVLGLLVSVVAAGPWFDDDYYEYYDDYNDLVSESEPRAEKLDAPPEAKALSEEARLSTLHPHKEGTGTWVEEIEIDGIETLLTEEQENTEEPITFLEEEESTPTKVETGLDEGVPLTRSELDRTKETPEELPVGDVVDNALTERYHEALPLQAETAAKAPMKPVILPGILEPENELHTSANDTREAPIPLNHTAEPNVTFHPNISRRIEIPIIETTAIETEHSAEPEPSDEPETSDYEEQTDFESATQEPDETFTEPTEEEEIDLTTDTTPATTEEPSTGGELGPGPTKAEKEVTPEDGLDLDDAEVNLDESCTQHPTTMMCRTHHPMFYFDQLSSSCRQFAYGGCQGTANVHETAALCYAKCHAAWAAIHVKKPDVVLREYLTLHDGKGDTTLTFMGDSAAAMVDDEALIDFAVNEVFEFEFSFRTDSPHGLIAFLRQVSMPIELEGSRIQLYIYLKRGHLGVSHAFGNNIEHFLMKKGGLQDGAWHSVIVKLSAVTGQLVMEVNHAVQEEFTVTSLRDSPSYGSGHSLEYFSSRLWVGGVFKESLEKEDVVVGFSYFHGCLKGLSIMSGETSEDMIGVTGFRTSRHRDVKEKCRDNCGDRYMNLCSPSSTCVEHFDHISCNCFKSNQDGELCDNPYLPVLSLTSDGYVVHRLYEWMDRVKTYSNLISLEFKTRYSNSILFYASAEHPEKQYLAASINEAGNIYVEANFGGGAVGGEIKEWVTKDVWFKLTIIQQQEKLQIYLDNDLHKTLLVPGAVRYLHLNPDFYVGNAPKITRFCGLAVDRGTAEGPQCQQKQQRFHYDVQTGACLPFNYTGCGGNENSFLDEATCTDTCDTPGLRSFNTFLGCMKNVFYNDVSIIKQLKENDKATRYYGVSEKAPISRSCAENIMVLVTLSTEKASIRLNNPNPNNFRLVVSFRPTQPRGVLASGLVDILDTKNKWEIRHDEKHVQFYVHDDLIVIKPKAKIKIGHWQYLELSYERDRIVMRVNQETVSKKHPGDLFFSSEVTIGASLLEEFPGFVGCLRKLHVGGETVDLRSLVGTDLAHRDVTFDNCQVLGPCERPGSCEHGASCTVVEGGVSCDCTGTGYTGKKCHFSLYKKSCELYRQNGYNTSGIYRIDVDGNGPLPPSFVKCDFSDLTGETTTIVEHNLPRHYDVRKPNLGDLEINVDYREFSHKMLKTIIDQSEFCTQKMRYDCRRSPLALYSRTWFSSPSDDMFTSFGSSTEGICRCKEINACDKQDVACNCDIGDSLPRSDQGVISDPLHLPITSMVFLKDRIGQQEESEAFITLGPLKCTKEAAEKQTVSFTKPGSYLEVPAWREGSLFLSFKTTSKTAVIAYQPAYHPDHATFQLSLVGDKELEFTYNFHEHTHHQFIPTRNSLNTGAWQQVLIEFHDHQLRLSVNFEEKILDIDKDANLGVLDGSMFLGAIPPQFQTEEDKQEGLEGLVGCIRGLTLNDEVVNLKTFVRASAHGVSTGCLRSCDPNPCKNGAECIEKWGTYECVCQNPYAHSGRNCENNINENGITFTTEESKYMYFVNETLGLGEYSILSNGFLLNFRTHSSSGLIFFAHDYLHNFVQLFIANEDELVFMFNHQKDVKRMVVKTDGGEVLNSGQPVQVIVERTPTSTDVFVYVDSLFRSHLDVGVLLLQEEDYEQFPFGESRPMPEMVYYPHSVTRPSPFTQAYMGSGNDRQRDVQCAIPGFIGCLRGFKIGSKLISLTDLVSRSVYPVEDIKLDCNMACDLRPCLNGGTCIEDFHYYNNFQCDCADTSYTGATCKAETAYTFFGRQWISQDSALSPIGSDFTFELAFSTTGTSVRPQLLAVLRSTDIETAHDYLLVSLESDGSLMVTAQLSDLDGGMVLGATVAPSSHDFQAFNGYRHHVVVAKTDSEMTLKVDRQEHPIVPLWNISLEVPQVKTSPTGLYLGGLAKDVDSRLGDYDNFHGCISNVRLRTPDRNSEPLRQYNDNDQHLRRSGMPGYGSCAGFAATRVPGILLAYGDNLNVSAVMGSEWSFMTAQRKLYHTVYAPPSHPERDTRMDDTVPIVSGIVFLVSAVIIITLLLRSHLSRKRKAMARDEEELQPLFNGGHLRTEIFTVSEKVPLGKSVEDGFSPDVKAEPDTDLDTKVEEVPLMEAPPTASPEEAQPSDSQDSQGPKTLEHEEDSEVGGSPLSWDKSADNLPLTIGSQDEQVAEQPAGDSSSESSIDCTLNISGTPANTPTTPMTMELPTDLGILASRRVEPAFEEEEAEAGSDGEPRMLSYTQLSGEFEEGRQKEEIPAGEGREIEVEVERHPQVGDEEVQRIVRDEEENEYVVVDDEPEGKEPKDGEGADESEPETKDEDAGDEPEAKEGDPEISTEGKVEDEGADHLEGADVDEQVEVEEGGRPGLDNELEVKEDDQSEVQDEVQAHDRLEIKEEDQSEVQEEPSDSSPDHQLEVKEDGQADAKSDDQWEMVAQHPGSDGDDESQPEPETQDDIGEPQTESELDHPDSTIAAREDNKPAEEAADGGEAPAVEAADGGEAPAVEAADGGEALAVESTDGGEAPAVEAGNGEAPADNDEDFIEMRPEHEEILSARRMTSKTFQEFEGHEQPDNLTFVEGETSMGTQEENNGLGREDCREITEDERCVSEEKRRDSRFRDEIPEREPLRYETLITPKIIISPPDEPLVCSSQTAVDPDTFLDASNERSLASSDALVNCEENEDIIIMGKSTEEDQGESEDEETSVGFMEGESEYLNEEMLGRSVEEQRIDEDRNHEDKGPTGSEARYFQELEDAVRDLEMNQEARDAEQVVSIPNQEARDEEQDDNIPSHSSPPRPEPTKDISDEDWVLLRQISRDGGMSDRRSGSPVSEDSSEQDDVPTYLNYIQDDDICLQVVGTEGRDDPIRAEDSKHLETITEQDESDDEYCGEEGAPPAPPPRVSSLRLKNLSAGMYNLNTIAEGGADDRDFQLNLAGAASPEPEESPSGHPPTEGSSSSPDEEGDEVDTNQQEAAKERVRLRSKRGRIVKEKPNPIFLSENLRTFGNPISYLGGPSIEYDDEDSDKRTDSLISTTSLD